MKSLKNNKSLKYCNSFIEALFQGSKEGETAINL